MSFVIAFYLGPFRFEKGGVSHPGENFILVYFKMANIYILSCAETITNMISCGGYISKLTESRETFAAWFLLKL